MTVLVGADPELFVRRGRHFISGHEFPCGTKAMPRRTFHGSVQVDGIALEVNVMPADTCETFVANVKGVLQDLTSIVKSVDVRAGLVIKPSIFMGSKKLNELPPEVRKLGCEPDYDAYTGEINDPPDAELPFRTGAGHVHVGWTQDQDPRAVHHFQHCAAVARELDYYLGMPSLKWDTDTRRRKLYGKAGAFRPKSYGLEYRTLSNAWLEQDYAIKHIFNKTQLCMENIAQDVFYYDKYGDLAKEVVNSGEFPWSSNQWWHLL